MPSGGEGYYYFSVFLTLFAGDAGFFDLQINGDTMCMAFTDKQGVSGGQDGQAACNVVAYITEGMK